MSGSRLYSSALLGPLAEQVVDAAGIRAGMHVIDVLAGNGHLTRRLAVAVAAAQPDRRGDNIAAPRDAHESRHSATPRPTRPPGWPPARHDRGIVVAVERDSAAAAALSAEFMAARCTATVLTASPRDLPYHDGAFDVALSLLTLPGGEPGSAILGEMQRIAAEVVVVVNADESPTPEALLATAWREVTGTIPEPLRAPPPLQLPEGWSTVPLQDVARFDSADQLRTALLDHHTLSADDDVLAALSSRFADLLQPFQGADGTLRIRVCALLMRTPD